MQNEVLQLPIRFEKNGFLYWQVCRTPAAAIYEQRTKDGRSIFFEVWLIRTQPARTFRGINFPAAERGPSDNDWGKCGWTYYRMQDAKIRYDQVNGWDKLPADRTGAKNANAQATR